MQVSVIHPFPTVSILSETLHICHVQEDFFYCWCVEQVECWSNVTGMRKGLCCKFWIHLHEIMFVLSCPVCHMLQRTIYFLCFWQESLSFSLRFTVTKRTAGGLKSQSTMIGASDETNFSLNYFKVKNLPHSTDRFGEIGRKDIGDTDMGHIVFLRGTFFIFIFLQIFDSQKVCSSTLGIMVKVHGSKQIHQWPHQSPSLTCVKAMSQNCQ